MKSLAVIIVAFSTTVLVLSVVVAGAPAGQEYQSSLRIVEDKPPGYLLGFRNGALYKLELDGNISHLWSYDLGGHNFISDNLFAVDVEKELVYLGLADLFVALDLNTGEIRAQIPLKPPNLQYFWNYDYVAKDNAIYGVCTGNWQWNWCRIKLHDVHLQKIKVEFLYQLPSVILELGPANDLYYMDKDRQLIWYYPGGNLVFGINYTTGELIFQSLSTLQNDTTLLSDSCIVHDYGLNRTFTLAWGYFLTYPLLAELHPKPKNETVLMELPLSLRCSNFGTCAYYQKTHTMMALMANISTFMTDSMLYYLVLIDVVDLTYEVVPLPGLRQFTNTIYPLTAIKFVQNAT